MLDMCGSIWVVPFGYSFQVHSFTIEYDIAPISEWKVITPKLWYIIIMVMHFQEHTAAFTFKLGPGMVLFIDNWRVLHGRSGFTGYRELCGCFLNRDEWLGKLRAQRIVQWEMADWYTVCPEEIFRNIIEDFSIISHLHWLCFRFVWMIIPKQ